MDNGNDNYTITVSKIIKLLNKTNTVINDDDITDLLQYYDLNIKKEYLYPKLTTEYIISEYTDPILVKRCKQFNYLKSLTQYEQRSKQWFDQREGMITASDIGAALELNHKEPKYKLILKKCNRGPEFTENKFVHHGKKYEQIATMIYERKFNIRVEEFGLIPHPLVKCIGASPDGIATKYTLDGKLSTMVSRMLEIKCPYSRTINLEGDIYGHICPEYYWAQVQIQLEVCDLDECDFWQCKIEEYVNREEFIKDSDPNCPFLSKEHGTEKGCIIQLAPKNKINEYYLFYCSYIYPDRLDMTNEEYDQWILNNINCNNDDYVFDKVIYWKLTRSKNVLIVRDMKWFNESLPIIQQTWDTVSYYRKNTDKLDELEIFIDQCKYKRNQNKIIFEFIDKQMNNKKYTKPIKTQVVKNTEFEQGAFISSDEDNVIVKKDVENIVVKKKVVRKKKSKPIVCTILSDSDD